MFVKREKKASHLIPPGCLLAALALLLLLQRLLLSVRVSRRPLGSRTEGFPTVARGAGGVGGRLWDPDESHGGCVLFFCLFLGSTLFYSLTVLSIN